MEGLTLQYYLWGVLGSGAGAVAAVSLQDWRHMTRGQIAMLLFVAASFAFFVAPLFFSTYMETRASGGVFFLLAAGSSIFLPKAMDWLSGKRETPQ